MNGWQMRCMKREEKKNSCWDCEYFDSKYCHVFEDAELKVANPDYGLCEEFVERGKDED